MSSRRLEPAPDIGPTAIREVDPAQCANRHPWSADGSWHRAWYHCGCAGGEGHRVWSHNCGAPPIYDPPHDEAARWEQPYP